jgi:hypothetical protein
MQQPGTPASAVRGEDQLVRMVQDLQREVRELKAANPFTPMGMYPKAGGLEVNGFIHSLRSADGSLSLSLDSAADAFIAYDAAGNDMVRIGKMAHVNPGVYGVEVKYNGSWLQVGGGNVDWGNISNKPATYAPSAHGHAGSDISGVVYESSLAQGSWQAFNQNVPGTTFYAVWVGNGAGNQFGRNTSSVRYKTNIREHYTDPANVLALTPVIYDRLEQEFTDADGNVSKREAAIDEYGLIAEQVHEHFPELVTWYEGKIDGIRYDLLSVALLSVVKDQEARINALERMAETAQAEQAKTGSKYAPPVRKKPTKHIPPGRIVPAEDPLPYTIQPQA